MTIEDENLRTQSPGDGASKVFPYNFKILDESDLLVVLQDSSGIDTEQTITTQYAVSGVGNAAGGNVTMVTAPAVGESLTIILDPLVKQTLDLTNTSAFPSQSVEDALDRLLNIIKRDRDLVGRALALFDGDTDGSGRFDANSNKIANLGTPILGTDAATAAYVASLIDAAVLDTSVVVSSEGADLIKQITYDAMLSLLGGGSKGMAIFKDVSSAAVMTELGMDAFFQTLIGASSASAFRALVSSGLNTDPHLENIIINGDPQVWQNGTTFNSVADASYLADQFVLLSNGSGVVDVIKSGTFPSGGRGAIQATVRAGQANTKFGFLHIIDNQRTLPLRGQVVSGSVDVQISGSLTGMQLYLLSWSGGADIPTLDVVNGVNWNSAIVAPSLATNWAYVSGGNVTVAATTSWAKFSFSNVQVPAGADNLALFLVTSDSSWADGDIVRPSKFNLVPGTLATQFSSRSYEEELRSCQKFFAKTFQREVAPAQNIGDTIGTIVAATVQDGAANTASSEWRYPVEMLKDPTVVTYNPAAAASSWRQVGAAANSVATITDKDAIRCFLKTAGGAAGGDQYMIHASANARF